MVRRFPTAILAASIGTLAAAVWGMGYLLESIRLSRTETARLAYLALPALQPDTLPRGTARE